MPKGKSQLLEEFSTMKDFEEWTANFYRDVSFNPKVENADMAKLFKETASDEDRHSAAIERIINIINNL